MIRIIGSQPSVANQFLSQLRDEGVQQDRMRFRKNLERLGEIMAVEISKALVYEARRVDTPLGSVNILTLEAPPVLIGILRAGLPYFQGFLNYFDQSDGGFIGAYRREGEEISVAMDYLATPPLEGRALILIDPMLATGRSVTDAVRLLLQRGTPAHVHVAGLVAAPEGLRHIDQTLRVPHTVWAFAEDEKLNHRFYIVPGLGDAGDLSYGPKV